MRSWNAPPDDGGKYMWEPGCTIIDITDHSYAIFLPAHQTDGLENEQAYRSLRLRPLDGHEWLTRWGKETDDPDYDLAWIEGEDWPAPVTSLEAVREVWPSFPPEPPSINSNSKCKNTEANGDNKAQIKHEKVEEEAEGSPESGTVGSFELLAEQPSASRKRKRESESEKQRVWSAIEGLLISCPPTKLGIQKRRKTFRPLLKRFMDTYPEHFADKHPGAVPLLLAAFTYSNEGIKDLDLHRFQGLSGDQVVKLVESAVAHNKAVYKKAAGDLKILDISFNPLLTLDDIARIVKITGLDELIIWKNPGISQDDVVRVANGRIAKVTTRDGFLAPLKKLATSGYDPITGRIPYDPAPPFGIPTQKIKIRQVMWMMLGTLEVNPLNSQPDLDSQLRIPKGKLSLEILDLDTLAVLLHPDFRNLYEKAENTAFAQAVAFPCHDACVPLAEFYTSIARFEKFMSYKLFIDYGLHWVYAPRWPVAFSMLMATGNEQSEYLVSSAFPSEAFGLPTKFCHLSDIPATRGPYPIVHGEYTLIFLREPDHGRLRLGFVTRTSAGQLTVLDPAAAAKAAGDEKAARVWRRGIGALPPWTGEESTGERRRGEKEAEGPDRYRRDTMLLDEAAVEKILAAAGQLSADRENIEKKIRNIPCGWKEKRERELRAARQLLETRSESLMLL
ncbi:hypothetical protein F4802DRAFT_591235, partial [Xylaria palmicola]